MHEIISCNLIKPYPCPLLAGLLALLLQLDLQFLLYLPLSESKDIFQHCRTSVPISYVIVLFPVRLVQGPRFWAMGSGFQVLDF